MHMGLYILFLSTTELRVKVIETSLYILYIFCQPPAR